MPLSCLVRPSKLWLTVLLLAAAGCRDSSSPSTPITITLETSLTGGPTITSEAGSTLVECGVLVEAVATGEGTALWESGALYFYSGKDRREAEDTVPLSPETVARYWDATQIAVGQVQQMRLSFRASFPFGVRIEMRYRAATGGARTRTTDAEIVCGPVGGPNSIPPTVTALSVQPANGQVEPGQSITVQYAAQSPLGILQTVVRLSGACEHVVTTAELLAPAVTRSVEIPLPVPCGTDRPLVITAMAIDATRDSASRELSMMLTMIDFTPPAIHLRFYLQGDANTPVAQPAGEYFSGDSIVVGYELVDAHGVAALVWESLPSGERDSLMFAPGTTQTMGIHRIPIPATWGTGPIQLRLHVRDVNGLTSAAFTSDPNLLTVFPTLDRVARTMQVSGDIQDIAIDTRRGVLYVRQFNQHRITVISLATMQVTANLLLDDAPWDFDITPGGDSLIVVLPEARSLVVIDLRSAPYRMVSVPLTGSAAVGTKPRFVRAASTGKVLLALDAADPRGYHRLAEVDLATGAVQLRADAGDGGNIGSGPMERSHDGAVILINGGTNLYQRYEASLDRFTTLHPITGFGVLPSVDGSGRRFAFSHDVFGEDLSFLRRVNATEDAGRPPSVLSPSGEHLYTLRGLSSVVRWRVSDGAKLDRLANPIPAGLFRVSGDGSLLVTSGVGFAEITVLSVFDLR